MQRKSSGAGEDYFTAVYDLNAFRADKTLNGKLYDLIDMHKDRIGILKHLDELTEKIRPVLREELGRE